ncbi:anaphase promoting complex subunit CDC23 [Sporobolomyces salmoneus]|uniref:anaphase promoting complex subunit CDC23 n=1 Tax=Sporobolomyces salmoneus TaxID=183962 RepID=UPI003172B8AF
MSSIHRPRVTSPPLLPVLRAELRAAVSTLLERNLNHSSKWAAQLLRSLPAEVELTQEEEDEAAAASAHAHHVHFRTSTPVKSTSSASASTLQHPAVASLIGHTPFRGGGGVTRSRDSVGSVMSIGPASSPAFNRELDDLDDEQMHPEDPVAASSSTSTTTIDTAREGDERAPKRKREWIRRDETEQDVYLLGLTLARNHELMRAAHSLRKCKGSKGRWLRCYSKYLAGEKRAVEDSGEPLGQKDLKPPKNPYARELLEEMSKWESGFVNSDGFLLYLKALLLLSLPPGNPSSQTKPSAESSIPNSNSSHPSDDIRLTALDLLVQSVKLEPYNWSAWVKIASCLEGPEELEATIPFLPECYPLLFFYVHCTLEIHSAGEKLHSVLDDLEEVFSGPTASDDVDEAFDDREAEAEEGGCSVIKGLRALVYYHVRDFDESLSVFDSLQRSDPYRVEDVDILSNILYVSEKRAELAKLAQDYVQLERMRPEVCCLVGNYYSLRRDHEKAIVYFRRALKLDRGYLSAWTLMGHEYIEIKNTNAAIASYRRAVDVNRKDYRAWYGLGQTYELLGESFYALNYYRRATGLRPYDPRMWAALAGCYEKLKRIPDAIQCYQRALVASDPPSGDIDLLLRIGRLYSALPSSTTDRAMRSASYYQRALDVGLDQGMGSAELIKIYVWLAKWEMNKERVRLRGDEGANGGDLERAEEYLKVVEGVQEGKEEAKGLLKELEMLILSRE